MTEVEASNVISLFYCYDRADKELRNVLEKHLKALRKLDFVESWSDLDVHAGSEHSETIKKHLQIADIILVLISASFFASDYNSNVLMKLALERYYAGEALVILILLRPVHWEDEKLSKLMRLPSSGKPVTAYTNRDTAFEHIVEGLHGILKDVWLKKGDAYYKAKRYDQACFAFEKAILQNPQFGPAHTRRGCVLHDLGYDQDAIVSFRSAIHHDPMDAYAHYLLGTLFYYRMDYEHALPSLAKAIQLNHLLTSAHIYMGLALEQQGEIDEAMAVYGRYLELHPNDPLIAYFRRDLHNRFVSKEFQRQMQRMGDQFFASLERFYKYRNGQSADIEEAPLLTFMRAFRESMREFQKFASRFADTYYDFLDHLRTTLFSLIKNCDVIENDDIRHLLLTILNKEKTQLEVRTSFIRGLIEYLQGLEYRGIHDLDAMIDEWNRVLDRIISELEGQHHQSQNLLNTLRRIDSEDLFQINVEEDKQTNESQNESQTVRPESMPPLGRVGFLRVETGKEPVRTCEIRKEEVTIGRSQESDVFLADLAVSLTHATVFNQGNGNYAVRDNQSANGTKVNGQPLTAQQLYPLQEGDRIQLGQTVLVFSRK